MKKILHAIVLNLLKRRGVASYKTLGYNLQEIRVLQTELEEDALLASRRASSACKKGMFSNVEGHVLVASSVSPRMERRIVVEKY